MKVNGRVEVSPAMTKARRVMYSSTCLGWVEEEEWVEMSCWKTWLVDRWVGRWVGGWVGGVTLAATSGEFSLR